MYEYLDIWIFGYLDKIKMWRMCNLRVKHGSYVEFLKELKELKYGEKYNKNGKRYGEIWPGVSGSNKINDRYYWLTF